MRMPRTEREFPDLVTGDAVGQEIQALVQRRRLLRRLETVDGRARRDLRGAPVDETLAIEMARQLVARVDLSCHSDAWPIRAGVRIERLAYSPWLDGIALPGRLALPQRAEDFVTDFVTNFARITGIEADNGEAMEAAFRVTPLQLGEVAMQVRGKGGEPSEAFLLLLSRRFDEAVEASDVLGKPSSLTPYFKRPVIDGFRLLAEQERAALIVADLRRLNEYTAPEIKVLLDDPGALAEALAASPGLRRLLSYVMVGTDVLGGLHNAEAAGYVPVHASAWTTILRRAELGAAPGDIERILLEDGELMRLLADAAFPKPGPDDRQSVLGNHHPATFWSLNNLILPFVAQDDIAKAGFRGGLGGRDNQRSLTLPDRSRISRLILAHGDPDISQGKKATARKQAATKGLEVTGENRQKIAGGYAKYYLPPREEGGSAPRFDPTLWGAARYKDRAFWAMFVGDLEGLDQLNLSEEERDRIVSALAEARRMFGERFVRDQSIPATAEVLCDLATSVSALTVNRSMSRALAALLNALAQTPQGPDEPAMPPSHRWRKGSAKFLKDRRRRGDPPSASGERDSARQLRRAAATKQKKEKPRANSRVDNGELYDGDDR